MITKVKYIICGICVICGMLSCVDTVILPDNKTVDEDYWQKKSEVETVVAAAYAQLRSDVAIRNMIVWGFSSLSYCAAADLFVQHRDRERIHCLGTLLFCHQLL